MSSHADKPKKRRFPLRRLLAAGLIGLVVLWLVHPPLMARALRFGLEKMASDAGLKLEVADIQASLTKPIVIGKPRIRAINTAASRTAADASRIEISLNWPWQAFFGEKRLIRSMVVEDLRGVFDFRAEAGVRDIPRSQLSADRQKQEAESTLYLLPQAFDLRKASVEFLANNQSYFIDELSADFSEQKAGRLYASTAEIHAGPVHETLGTLRGVTAWKAGTAYVGDLALRDGLKVDSFEAQMARPEGFAVGLEAAVYDGSLRADVSFGSEKGALVLDAAVWASDVRIAPLSTLLGFKGNAEGILREGRFTFRGNPDQALDGQASLRLVADGFLWNKRGWESFKVGANLIHRRLAVSDFELRQKENTLSGSGEVTLTENWSGLAKAPFLVNLSGSIKDLGTLAAVLGPPFDEMSGRMSLSSSVTGQDGKFSGFLSLEASQMKFRKHPVDSGRVEVAFANNEARFTQCDFWSGGDYLRGKGTLAMTAPYNYSGEIQARSQDVATYARIFQSPGVPAIYGGAVQIRWQGDGTLSSHSGAFNLSLDDFVSEHTPSGLTGRFAGTYSPKNIYFSGFELQQNDLRFNTRATLANSGIKLKDAVLRSGDRDVADAEVFVPLDPFAWMSGKPFMESVLPDQEIYADVATRSAVKLRDILKLLGNDLPAEGTVRLDVKASGTPAALNLESKLEGRGLAMRYEKNPTPPSQVDASFKAANGEAVFTGALAPRGQASLKFDAQTPFGFLKAADGSLRWMNPEGKVSARLEIPKTNLEVFRPLWPKLQELKGTIVGGISASGTAGRPELNGQLAVAGGRVKFSPGNPAIENLTADVKFEGSRVALERFSGTIGAGPFVATGSMSFGDTASSEYDFTLTGSKLLLFDDPSLRLSANVDLHAAGKPGEGSVAGSILLVDGRILKGLEVTPRQAASPVDEAFFVPPQFAAFVPSSLSAWKLKIDVRNETPFTLAGGELIPELRLAGTLGSPIPLGRIELKDARAFLPFTTMSIDRGYIDFTESAPWVPQLNVRATARALDYDVQIFAFGPLNERHMILRSDPPLAQESIVLLLTAGLPPGVYSGANLGELSTGQGGVQLLRSFTRPVEAQGSNRLQISSIPPELQGARSALRGRFRLWQGLALTSDREGFDYGTTDATYTLRLR